MQRIFGLIAIVGLSLASAAFGVSWATCTGQGGAQTVLWQIPSGVTCNNTKPAFMDATNDWLNITLLPSSVTLASATSSGSCFTNGSGYSSASTYNMEAMDLLDTSDTNDPISSNVSYVTTNSPNPGTMYGNVAVYSTSSCQIAVGDPNYYCQICAY